jgi:DNA-binding GntR family transcriptional regulator
MIWKNMNSTGTTKKSNPRRVQLAQQIIQLALQEDWDVGHHVKEQHLVDRLNVSRSPIRSALKLLEEQGAVTAKPHHGFFLAEQGPRLSGMDLEVPLTKEEQLYLELIDARTSNKILSSFTQADIMRRYDVNRNILMRTLNRMADEGLVIRNPGQGWTFVPTLDSVQSRKASYEFRKAVEPATLLSDTLDIDPQVLTKMRLNHVDLMEKVGDGVASLSWIYETDANFHETLASFSGNQFFLNAVIQQNRLRQLLEFRDAKRIGRVTEWCAEHLAIIDALERGNPKKAATRLFDHLERAQLNQ